MKEFFKKMSDDHISEYSAQCAYYTILSFIPFLILLITLIQYTDVTQQDLFNAISTIVPTSMNDFVLGIVKEVYSKSIGTISISIVFTILSAGKGLFAMTKGLNEVNELNDKKSNSYIYLKIKTFLETILFIFLINIGLVLMVFVKSLVPSTFMQLSFILVTFLVFVFIYSLVPTKKESIKSHLPGALFGTIVLNIVSYAFSIFLDIFKGFSITYGSLTALMLIMMWIYSCFYTLFLGAEINKLIKS